jgi:hypothetical protein
MDSPDLKKRRRGQERPALLHNSAVSFQRAVKCLNQSSFVAVDENISIDQ